MGPTSTMLGFGYVVGRLYAAAASVLTSELGEGCHGRRPAKSRSDFAYCAPLNLSWPRFR